MVDSNEAKLVMITAPKRWKIVHCEALKIWLQKRKIAQLPNAGDCFKSKTLLTTENEFLDLKLLAEVASQQQYLNQNEQLPIAAINQLAAASLASPATDLKPKIWRPFTISS